MQENFGARGRERRFVIIKGSIEELFGRDPGIDPRRAQQIESGGGEWNQLAPHMHWKF